MYFLIFEKREINAQKQHTLYIDTFSYTYVGCPKKMYAVCRPGLPQLKKICAICLPTPPKHMVCVLSLPVS